MLTIPANATEETALLAEVLAQPQWAHLPIVRIVSWPEEDWYDNPILKVYIFFEWPQEQPLFDAPRDASGQNDWEKLMSINTFITRWYLRKESERYPIVNLKRVQHNVAA